VAAIAAERPMERRASRLRQAAARGGALLLVLAALWGLWEGYRWVWTTAGFTWPFPVDDTTMPHLHTILSALFEPSRANGPLLIHVLLDSALFTAKEAAAGFALGAIVGFALAIVLAHSRLLQRGFLPYIVASQTVPILAVVWLGSLSVPAWFSVAVIAAYLTFFPVTINSLRGLQSADPRAVELMRSYAASRWAILWRLRVPASLPYVFSALRVAATGSVVGAIVGELPSSIPDGLGGAILNFAQYYSFQPQNLWATNVIAALLGILFFVTVVLAERLVVRRAPENVA
jgi:NitT/TauT family transport system permease protein